MYRVEKVPAVVALLVVLATSGPVFGDEVLNGSVGLDWWSNGIDAGDGDGEVEIGDVNGFAEVWWNRKWGIRGARYQSALDDIGVEHSDHLSIDLKRRMLSLADDTFVGLGAGWGEIDLDDGDTSSGLRLTAEGRFGLGDVISLYGQTSWLPELGDAGSRSNLEGQEFEAGLSYEPASSMSLRVGFRRFRLDFEEGGSATTSESDGFIFGAGFKW